MKRLNGIHLLSIVFCFVITCTDLTNPFLEREGAMARIVNSGLAASDTVSIFSTYSIRVDLYLREHLDSFKIHIDKNRFWVSSDTVVSGIEFISKYSYSFPVSFFDTGWQKIQLISYVDNGTTVKDSCKVYVSSPLSQAEIKGGIGDSILLSTNPVSDRVLYVWDFHNGVIIREFTPAVKTRITTAFTSQIGELYVEDLSKNRSPSVLFQIENTEQAALKIVCINDSVLSDSVYSSTSAFKFSLEVSGAQQLKSARVNGKTFHDSLRMGELFVLNYNVNGLDTIKEPVRLDVFITDNLDRNFSRSYYIHYVKIIPVINVLYPVDSMQTASTLESVLGNIGNFEQYGELYLLVKNNGADQSVLRISRDKPVFTVDLSLPNPSNHILLILYPDSQTTGTRLTEIDFYLFYNPEFVDTTPPQIRGKRCNGEPVDTYYTSRTDSMLLELDIVDNSRLTVTVNGIPVVKGGDELFYSTKIFVEHGRDSTPIIINAADSVGYSTQDTLFVKYNRLPEWIETPSYSVIIAGEESIFEISVSDPDNDSLFVTMTIIDSMGDIVILNAGSGQISWTPQLADIGVYDAILRASDGYESIEKNFVIVVKGIVAVPVKFLTTKENFPDTVYIGKSINVILEEIPLTGTRPFNYAAYFTNSEGIIIKTILDGTDSIVQWTATAADTIVRKLHVSVKDSCGLMDSIVTDIVVMKEIVSFLRWENNYSPKFIEGGSAGVSMGLIMKPALNYEVSIPYKISFPATDDVADSLDFGSELSGYFTFSPGDTLSSLFPVINDDSIPELTEKFEVINIEPDSIKFKTGVDKVFHGEIMDNDMVYYYFNETEAARVEMDTVYTAVVKLSRPLEKVLELTYIVDESSTATLGKDFTLDSNYNKVVFEPGETQAEIKIYIKQDLNEEQDETIVLKLDSDDSFAESKDGFDFVFTIYDDLDVSPQYSFVTGDSSGSENISEVRVKVRFDRPLDTAVVLLLSVTDSNMVSGIDYSVNNGFDTLIFAEGTIEREISINVVDDTIPVDQGFIRINLSSNSEFVKPGVITSFRYNVTPNEVPVIFNGNFVGANEWPATYRITVRVDGYLESDLVVYYKADTSSTAEEGSDYSINSTCYCVTLPRGHYPSVDMEFTTIDDYRNEGHEIINFVLTEVSNKEQVYVGSQSVCTVKIDDNGNDTW